MFETLFTYSRVLRRHREGPLAEERAAYLAVLAAHSVAPATLLKQARCCLRVAVELERWPADHCFDIDEVGEMASRYSAQCRASSSRYAKEHFRSTAADFLGTDQNRVIHLYTHERACPEARSARGRGVSNNARARQPRGLVQCRRGRTAEQREPVVDPLSGQALVSTGPLVPSPAPRAQIEPGTEQVEKALSGALVDVEIGA